MRRWYAVHCKPREDERAERHLSRQCYAVFRPLVRLRRRRGARMATLIESLFPRYLFVHLDALAENTAPIRSTRGVAGLVSFGKGPAEVPEAVIRELRARTDPHSGCVALQTPGPFRCNQGGAHYRRAVFRVRGTLLVPLRRGARRGAVYRDATGPAAHTIGERTGESLKRPRPKNNILALGERYSRRQRAWTVACCPQAAIRMPIFLWAES